MEGLNPYAPPASDPILPPSIDGGLPLASRRRRLAAVFVDWLIVLAIVVVIRSFTGDYDTSGPSGSTRYSMLFTPFWSAIDVGLFIVLNWVFLQNGQTIGKKLFKLQIQYKDGAKIRATRIVTNRILVLAVATLIPIIGVFIGVLDVLLIFRKSRYTLHDDIADTKVVRLPG